MGIIRNFVAFIALFLPLIGFAQVTLDPFFASQDDTVTVYYDATQGNGALAGQGQIYAHAGVITTASTGPTDWKFVQGNWGTADASVAMTNLGNDLHSIEIDIPNFYGFPSGTEVLSLAFVFRTADGSIVGRTAAGGDIFVPLYTGYGAILLEPLADVFILQSHESIDVEALASDPSHIQLFIDDSLVMEDSLVTELSYALNTEVFGVGSHYIIMEATDGNDVVRDSSYYVFQEPTLYAALPSGVKDGANYINDSTVILMLTCPIKDFAYVIGDFNNWRINDQYVMNRSLDSSAFWIEITGLESNVEYRYQYLVDQEMIRVADPYTHKVLDPWNDGSIPASTYPNLIAYPTGKTNEAVSILHINRPDYAWDSSIQYERPAPADLRIYELLIRDFTTARTYQSVIDSLPYLKELGINAIELMPVNEFEGNDSWGYNPSFYFAPDKYYGTEEKLKELIDEAHRHGIAVILDMVLNHSFGQSPLVRLFFDAAEYKPTEENPWFLQDPAHDYNVGYDMDHESEYTRKFVDDVMAFWVEEYRIDGYRMDLSKGFTSNYTLGNVGAWGQYDSSRVYNLSRMGEMVWEIDSTVYIILEHFANNSEEKDLASRGFLLWGNANHDYNECTMGYSANLNYTSYKSRGWEEPHLINFMESHDEERLMFRNLNYGKENATYSTKKPWTALARMEQAAVFFLSTPGPKMIWQFGEMGYDLSINRCENGTISDGCRLSPKPPRWNYLENSDRKRLFEVYAAMNALREEHDVFSTDDFTLFSSTQTKNIKLNHEDMNVVTVCNFDVVDQSSFVTFQHTGTWYEYFTGTSIEVTESSYAFDLAPGEYRLYTDVMLETPEITTSVESVKTDHTLNVFPNPNNGKMQLEWDGELGLESIQLMDITGRRVSIAWERSPTGVLLSAEDVHPGTYLLNVKTDRGTAQQVIIIQ
ncbi:MAG: alpha-amylase family glycosyl hydrolase [Cryomorphaceae bacterium]